MEEAHSLIIWNTITEINLKNQELLFRGEYPASPSVFSGSVLLIFFIVSCVVFFVLFVFILCLVSMLPVALDCPCLITTSFSVAVIIYSNMTFFFRFVDKRAIYLWYIIISFAHAPVNVTDFSIDSINWVRHFSQK